MFEQNQLILIGSSVLELSLPSASTDLVFFGRFSPCYQAWASGGRPSCLSHEARTPGFAFGKRLLRHPARDHIHSCRSTIQDIFESQENHPNTPISSWTHLLYGRIDQLRAVSGIYVRVKLSALTSRNRCPYTGLREAGLPTGHSAVSRLPIEVKHPSLDRFPGRGKIGSRSGRLRAGPKSRAEIHADTYIEV